MFEEKSIRELPGYDLVVAGGGSAGAAAAVAAGRRGRRVLVVEESNAIGGTSTTGGVQEWFATLDHMGDVFGDVVGRLEEAGACHGRHFNGEMLKIVWQSLLDEAGVDILFHASVVDAPVEDGTVQQAVVSSCSRRLAVSAPFFIDATGEGDLAAMAGAEFSSGDPEEGLTLHMSLTATMYDTGKPQTPWLPPGVELVRGRDELPGLGGGARLADGRLYMNSTKIMRHDPTDPVSLSAAEREARLQLAQVVHFLQSSRFPTYALASSGARIGIREGRRIHGEATVEEDDVLGRDDRHVPDSIAVATSQIDFHSLTKPGAGGWRQEVRPYAIPWGALVPKGLRNCLLAGKCISGDQIAMSSYRMTPTCAAMGQAAGTGAALALQSGIEDLREIDVGELQAVLREHGLETDPAKHVPFATEQTPDRRSAR